MGGASIRLINDSSKLLIRPVGYRDPKNSAPFLYFSESTSDFDTDAISKINTKKNTGLIFSKNTISTPHYAVIIVKNVFEFKYEMKL